MNEEICKHGHKFGDRECCREENKRNKFRALISRLKEDLLADKENPVSGVGALMMLEKML